MKKIGILTFHYSNNYGGVLQALCLHNVIKSLGHDVEIINFVPSSYKPYSIMANLGLSKNPFKIKVNDLSIATIYNKANIMHRYCAEITDKFNSYRSDKMNLTQQVDENALESILNKYSHIIVGSDQVWNPSQRKSPIYFLDFKGRYKERRSKDIKMCSGRFRLHLCKK